MKTILQLKKEKNPKKDEEEETDYVYIPKKIETLADA